MISKDLEYMKRLEENVFPYNSSAELGQKALDLAVSYIRDFLEEMKQIELSS